MASVDADAQTPTWAQRFTALRYVGPMIKLIWETHPPFAATMFVLRFMRALTPAAELATISLLFNAIIARSKEVIAQPAHTWHWAEIAQWGRIWHLVGILFAIVVAAELLARGSILIESLLGDLFANRISVRIMEHAATLDLAQFEDPRFYDLLERARRETVGRIGLLTQMLSMSQDAITLLTLVAGLVVFFSPVLLIILAITILPSFVGQTHFAAMSYSLLFRWTAERRLLDYLRFLAASDRTAKEVQMFRIAPWLTDRYRVLAHRFYKANRQIATKRAVVSAALSLLGTAGYYLAYVLIIVKTVRGIISIGAFYGLAGSFQQSRDIIQRLLLQASDVYEQALYLRDLFAFFDIKPTMAARAGAPAIPRPLRTGFVFEDVGFKYPGSDRWAVRHINLKLTPGQRIALVGENGSGKTTLTKLLARLYDPTEGRILLDGVDLRDYDIASVRQTIGVIFQDFVRYDFPLDENIGVGQIDQTRAYLDQAEATLSAFETRREGEGAGSDSSDKAVSRSRAASAGGNGTASAARTSGAIAAATFVRPFAPIVHAAEQSLATTLLARLPLGYRQMLGRRFQGGIDLSGGEWQKVALARAYLREAQVLILDEPTAALDARAEYEVFLRFSELVSGRTAVLISHRFSTVRMADRIVVLQAGPEGGHVVEEGTHQELVDRGGLYSELFAMQAAGYR